MTDLNAALDAENPWKAYLGELYFSRKPPHPLGTVSYDEIEAQAKEKLKDIPGTKDMFIPEPQPFQLTTVNLGAFMYAGGSAGSNSTYRANLRAFEKWGIIPRMLRDANNRTLEVRVHDQRQLTERKI